MFKFSLERVLELRAKREQAAAVTLASAREQAEEARRGCEELEQARAHGVLQIAEARGGGATVGQLQNFGMVLQYLDRQIDSAHTAAEQADAHVERCTSDLVSASQDRKVLDRLRDRHLLAWKAEEQQDDRKTMDAIALTRFVRTQASQNEEKR